MTLTEDIDSPWAQRALEIGLRASLIGATYLILAPNSVKAEIVEPLLDLDETEIIEFTVARGDILDRIAAEISERYGIQITANYIKKHNSDKIADKNVIFPGQVFKVPIPVYNPDPAVYAGHHQGVPLVDVVGSLDPSFTFPSWSVQLFKGNPVIVHSSQRPKSVADYIGETGGIANIPQEDLERLAREFNTDFIEGNTHLFTYTIKRGDNLTKIVDLFRFLGQPLNQHDLLRGTDLKYLAIREGNEISIELLFPKDEIEKLADLGFVKKISSKGRSVYQVVDLFGGKKHIVSNDFAPPKVSRYPKYKNALDAYEPVDLETVGSHTTKWLENLYGIPPGYIAGRNSNLANGEVKPKTLLKIMYSRSRFDPLGFDPSLGPDATFAAVEKKSGPEFEKLDEAFGPNGIAAFIGVEPGYNHTIVKDRPFNLEGQRDGINLATQQTSIDSEVLAGIFWVEGCNPRLVSSAGAYGGYGLTKVIWHDFANQIGLGTVNPYGPDAPLIAAYYLSHLNKKFVRFGDILQLSAKGIRVLDWAGYSAGETNMWELYLKAKSVSSKNGSDMSLTKLINLRNSRNGHILGWQHRNYPIEVAGALKVVGHFYKMNEENQLVQRPGYDKLVRGFINWYYDEHLPKTLIAQKG